MLHLLRKTDMTIHVLIYGCPHCQDWGIEEVFDDVDAANTKEHELNGALKTKPHNSTSCGSYWVESWEVH